MSEKSYPSIAQSFGIFLIIIAAQFVIGLIVGLVSGISNAVIDQELQTFFIYSLSVGIPLVIIHYRIQHAANKSAYNLKPENLVIILLLSVCVLCMQWGVNGPLADLIPMPDWAIEIFSKLLTTNTIFSFLTLVIAAPILEEFVFRGIMLRGLLKNYSPQKAIFWSSFLFGLVHLNPWQFIGAFIIGLFVGWIYYKTSNLLYCILVHAVNNGAAYLSLYLSDDKESLLTMSVIELYGGFFSAALVILGCLGIGLICIIGLRREFAKITDQTGTDD